MKILSNASKCIPNGFLSGDVFGFVFQTKILQQSSGKYSYRNSIVIGAIALLFCSYLLIAFSFLHNETSDKKTSVVKQLHPIVQSRVIMVDGSENIFVANRTPISLKSNCKSILSS